MREHGIQALHADPDQIQQRGVELGGGRTLRIPPEIVAFLAPELERAAQGCADLNKMLPDAALGINLRSCGDASLAPGNGALLVYRLSLALAALPEEQFRHLQEVTPSAPTGLAPLFSELSVAQLRVFSIRQLKGWVKSKVVEPDGELHASHDYYARHGILKEFDQAFIPWLITGLVRELRVRGPLLESLLSAGRTINDRGVLPLSEEEARSSVCGVRLGDGSLLQVPQRVLDVTAAGMHANWVLTRGLMAHLPNQALHPLPHVGDGSWSPYEEPDGRYAPDQNKALTVVGSTLSVMRGDDALYQDAHNKAIVESIIRLGTPESNSRFSRERVSALLAPYSALEGATTLTPTREQQALTVNRFALAAPHSEKKPSTSGRAWDDVSPARKLFERLQTLALVATWSRFGTSDNDKHAAAGSGAASLDTPMSQPHESDGARLQVKIGPRLAVAIEHMRNYAERLATELSVNMEMKHLRQAGQVENHLSRLANLDLSAPMLERQLARAKGLAFWLAADAESRGTLDHSLRISRGSPGSQATYPAHRALSPALMENFVVLLHEAREQLVKGPRAKSWGEALPHQVLSSTLYAHAALEFGVLVGREALLFLRKTGSSLPKTLREDNERTGTLGRAIDMDALRTAAQPFAEAFQILGIGNQQLIGIIAQDLKDPRLTPEGFKPPSKESIDALIARRAAREQVAIRERDILDVLAYAAALARMTETDFSSLISASYESGELPDLSSRD
jgi:hypothetical protein